ncbi:Pyridoxamine 5'-phosphate oxidase [Belliella buryatensis]|uniref:Pyridoxine/pyridoxamine 5'-phosphate oxidase n=1 Tax=Belliella buryatensis TaxID=1500549 RepID=A0A239DBN8_9BACT|nr:pyridoxamine 5'-phosphate oxidase [Belliella buryatensis]SNS29532.1 Pyridoxamine 5'-phosphate oxidase [Belliella buryatensis]
MKISDIRIEYALKSLDIKDVENEPLKQFKNWFDEAVNAKVLEVNAMNLATIQNDNTPNSRIVLLKGIEDGLVFYTNYNSTKGEELKNNPNVAVTFFWAELERQVRFLGKVKKVSQKESDKYFFSRPFSSQVGAWVSPQSQTIPDREVLSKKEKMLQEKFTPETISRPPHWGGYRIIIHEAEFWQGRPSRLHDRILYQLDNNGNWSISRIAP